VTYDEVIAESGPAFWEHPICTGFSYDKAQGKEYHESKTCKDPKVFAISKGEGCYAYYSIRVNLGLVVFMFTTTCNIPHLV
jgi:hypothetical protein